MEKLDECGIAVPLILIPEKGINFKKWSVIACDQFTQDRAYWEKVEDFVRGAPSAFNLILPEIYLEAPDREERVKNIRNTMSEYLDGGVFRRQTLACAFIKRETRHGQRRGLLAAVDLERYDYTGKPDALIRSTEETIVSRIPPRVAIREAAPLECPHIMLLINDENDILMSLLDKLSAGAPDAYSTELMFGGGRVNANLLCRRNDWALIADSFEHLRRKALTSFGNEFLFATGDGNHSLATAKAVWESYRKAHGDEPGTERHPLRYALVEIVNLYDPALVFEPIHRVLFNVDTGTLIAALKSLPGFSMREIGSRGELCNLVNSPAGSVNRYGVFDKAGLFLIETSSGSAATVDLEPVLLKLAEHGGDAASGGGAAIDYIHGEEELFNLVLSDGEVARVGVLLPPFRKDGFFRNIAENGPLPRKSFSMGDAVEKRYYLECRKLF